MFSDTLGSVSIVARPQRPFGSSTKTTHTPKIKQNKTKTKKQQSCRETPLKHWRRLLISLPPLCCLVFLLTERYSLRHRGVQSAVQQAHRAASVADRLLPATRASNGRIAGKRIMRDHCTPKEQTTRAADDAVRKLLAKAANNKRHAPQKQKRTVHFEYVSYHSGTPVHLCRTYTS